MIKFDNTFIVKTLNYELPSEYLNQECVIIEFIGDDANVMFNDESVWFVPLNSLHVKIKDI